jgi:hypothetical protein
VNSTAHNGAELWDCDSTVSLSLYLYIYVPWQ